jgi:hypothetical protein
MKMALTPGRFMRFRKSFIFVEEGALDRFVGFLDSNPIGLKV